MRLAPAAILRGVQDPAAAQAAVRAKVEEAMARLVAAAKEFRHDCRSQAQVDVDTLIDPAGEAVASLVDTERSPGAASLATPIDLIVFETWALGHLGDRDELDLDVNTHHRLWFGLGAWIGEAMRARHGGFWLFAGDDPRAWRVGFTKILLEIAPHAFAEKLLRAGQGMARRMVAEIERIRLEHEHQAAHEGGEVKGKFTPQHYARLHTVPLAQWLVLDMATVSAYWGQRKVAELIPAVKEAGQRLPPQNGPVLQRIAEALGKLAQDKPAAPQVADRGLYEAVAQVLGLRYVTAPVAVDLVEKLVLPGLLVGYPEKFPPLGDDDIENIRRGQDLFAVYVDVVPYELSGVDGGFLGTFQPDELGTPYPDRRDLELGRGDWLAVNPARLRPLLDRFDPKRMLATYERFVDYVARHEGVPRLRDDGMATAKNVARSLADLRACVQVMKPGHALVFRLLPPAA